MDDAEARRLARLFWGVCIPVRIAVGVIALVAGLYMPLYALPLLALYTGATTLGFLHNAALALRGQKSRGVFGGIVWWNRVRWVHIALWATTCVLAMAKIRWAAALLLVDAFIGIAAGYVHSIDG